MSDQSRIWHDLSSAQQAIWLDCAMLENPAAYQVGTVLVGKGTLDPQRAERATAAVIADHQALRLRIDADQPRQRLVAADYGALPFEMVHLADVAELSAHLLQCTRRGFALGADPLFRVDAIQAGPDDWAVLVAGHHLVVDGLSIGRVRDDWALAYGAPEGTQYPGSRATYFIESIANDAAYAGSDAMAADLDYWRDRLAGLPSPLLATATGDGSRSDAKVELSAEQYAALAEAARAIGTTAHRALLAITGLALGRRFGRDDLMIGMALHGRPNDHLETVGQFARVLPFRCTFDPALPLAEALRTMAAQLDADMKHQRVPMDAIGRALGGNGRDQDGLFEVAVSILPPPAMGLPRLGDMPASIQPQSGQEHSPLSVFMREQVDGSLVITFGHDPARLGAAEVARIADRIAAVIERLLERPTAKVSALSGLAKGEAARIAGFESGPGIALSSPLPVTLFAEAVARHGDAHAVMEGEHSWSYNEIDALSDGFAASFAARGVSRGDVVAVILERSCDTIAALIGLLKIGAVYLPIDPSQPEARALAMLEAADARLVVTQGAWEVALAGTFPVLTPEQVDRVAARPSMEIEAVPGDPAYVIFTSGSTGTPKGVVVPHRAIANLDAARQLHDPIGPGDRVLAAISVGFDVSIGQLFLPLLRGACVVVAPDVRMMTPAQFWAFLAHHAVTHINSVPSFFEAMLDGAPDDAQLKRLMLGGESLSAALARRLRAALNGTLVVNMYGPTETTVDASAYMVPSDLAGDAKSLPIGRPLPNYSFFILDEQLRQIGIGHVGELYIGGSGLALGYLGAPDLTAARFIDSDYGRIYRTGDLAAWREDGEVLFLGRADGQVKIRGYRIELGEIQAQLLAHPDVQSAAVIARTDSAGALKLLGYVVPREGAALDTAALRDQIAVALPSYMVPSAIMPLDRLPLTTNGKLDQRALPDPGPERTTGSQRQPEGALEQQVAALFCDLLNLPSVHADDDFFALGGHSLLATRLVGRLREETGAELRIRSVYEAPTVASLAQAIQAAPRANDRPVLVARSPRPDPLPLSFAQERLWFLDRLEPGSAAYNIPLVFRIDGALDPDAMRMALAQVIARHESLRTRFVPRDGEPVQIVEPQVECPFVLHDLAGADAAAVQQAVTAEALRPFDLQTAPLIRMALFRLGEHEHVAALTVHHIVADGWSMAILLDELTGNYVAAQSGLEVGRPALELHYADYAIWQRELLSGEELGRQRAYWLDALAGAPDVLNLPSDPLEACTGCGVHRLAMDGELGRAVAGLAARLGSSPFAVLMSAWSLLLGKWTGQRDLLVGTALAGRNDSILDNQIGFYVNTLPVRTVIDPATTTDDLVRQTSAQMMDVQAHQDMPFEQLVQALKPERLAGRHPLFQALFVLQNGPAPALALEGLAIRPVDLPAAPARFDLALSLAPDGQGYGGDISYAATRFAPATIAALAERFVALLQQMVGNVAPAIATFDALQHWGGDWDAGVQTVPASPETVRRAAPAMAVASLDPLERQVADLWSELTGVGPVGPDSDFFDIGGHSLVALRLTARLEAMLGKPVPVSLIFAYRSLRSYCAALRQEQPQMAGSPLVTLQQGAAPALFCIHPVGGGVFGYVPLMRELAPEREVWGLQARGFDDDTPPAPSIEAMAADYVTALRTVQPHGPYALMGHSFGGMVAYAMARQLLAAGEEVETLLLLDSDHPQATVAAGSDHPALALVPADKQALVAHHIALAQMWKPEGTVPRLAYLRADGDGRDGTREQLWLSHAAIPISLQPAACGHYAMLDADQAACIAQHLAPAMVHANFTMTDA